MSLKQNKRKNQQKSTVKKKKKKKLKQKSDNQEYSKKIFVLRFQTDLFSKPKRKVNRGPESYCV